MLPYESVPFTSCVDMLIQQRMLTFWLNIATQVCCVTTISRSLLCYRFTFFFCGRIRRLKSFHQTSDVFLAVLKHGGSLVTMTNDDKQWLTTTIHSEVQRQQTAWTCYHICNMSINELVTIFVICQLIYFFTFLCIASCIDCCIIPVYYMYVCWISQWSIYRSILAHSTAVECDVSSHASSNITGRRSLLHRVSSTLAYNWLSNATLP